MKVNPRYFLKSLIIIFVCLTIQTLNAQTFIKEIATGSASGVDWDNAMGAVSLETAIEAGGTVYIAKGIYFPTAPINLTTNVAHSVQGGFPASSTGTDISVYDPVLYPTVIDGGGVLRLFYNTIRVDSIYLTGLVLQNADAGIGAVFSSSSADATPIEFIFTDLLVQNSTSTGNGNFYFTNKTSVDAKITFSNCSFLNNNAGNGGAIYMGTVYNDPSGSSAIPGNLVIDNCSFEDNTSTLFGGGALYFTSSHAWIIQNSNFCNNTATDSRGGAINFTTSGSNVLDSCSFHGNTTNEYGGAIYGSFASATISNTKFVSNSSSSYDGGAISGSNSSWQIDSTDFYNNSALDGGAINSTSWYTGSVRSTAENCIFLGNIASGTDTVAGTNGGGALCIGANVNNNGWDIDSCTFVNNQAAGTSWGGAISHGEVETSITNSLFYNNTLGGNAAISGSDIKNYDNTGGFYIMSGNKMQLTNAASYTNQTGGTDASSYAFTDDTFLNVDDGSVPAAPTSPCIPVFNITGTVFEDINYGGGNGRNYSAADTDAQPTGWSAGAIGVSDVTVELYNNTGVLIEDTLTDASGQYTFVGIANGDYSIRVVNNTISSNRGSNGTGATIIPVQTFRTDGVTEVINEVGGASPALIDTTVNTASSNLSTLTTATATVQSITPVIVADAALTGIDFGFNFDVIVNINDSGQGSLRQFILNSNELSDVNLNQENNPAGGASVVKDLGWETSLFMIPGAGVHTIQALTQLPFIDDTGTHITGYTQDGSQQDNIQDRIINIELYGNTTMFDGLVLREDSSQVSGLSIYGFNRGIFASVIGTEEIFIWGNYIGMEADGITPSLLDGSGIRFFQTVNSFVGTNGDNVNDANEGNLISKADYGLQMNANDNVLVAGNYIGTDKTGLVNQGNLYVGIGVISTTKPNYIGFKDDMSNSDPNQYRNIISGNGNDGIRVVDSDSLRISGNYIGTNVLGTGLMGNVSYGVQLSGVCNDNVIGTNANGAHDTSERNIIVGNFGLRFALTGSGDGNCVAGNYLGTDFTGTSSLLGNTGVLINGTFTNTVIGTNGDNINDEVEYNIISGHLNDGIEINTSGGSAIIAGNAIGISGDWFTAMGNQERGIYIHNITSDLIIGWSPSMLNTDELFVGNRIKNNGDSGIAITGTGVNNRFSRNQIANNGGLGIGLNNSLGDFSVTPNDDGDVDTGENNLLNFPVIDSVYMIADSLTIAGFAPAGSAIEFYIPDTGVNPSPLPPIYTSSFGEGATFIDAETEGSGNDADASIASYTDDGTGSVVSKTQNRFEFTFDIGGKGLADNTPITALAIDATNNTSEFGNIQDIVEIIPVEICNDGIDNDGDGLIDGADDDCCGAQAPTLSKN